MLISPLKLCPGVCQPAREFPPLPKTELEPAGHLVLVPHSGGDRDPDMGELGRVRGRRVLLVHECSPAGVGRLPAEPTFQQPVSTPGSGVTQTLLGSQKFNPGGVMLLEFLPLHLGSHQVDRVTAERDSADGIHPILDLVERDADVFLPDFTQLGDLTNTPLTNSPSKSMSERHMCSVLGAPSARFFFPSEKGALTPGQVQARDDPAPLPRHLSAEAAEGQAGGLIGKLRLRTLLSNENAWDD